MKKDKSLPTDYISHQCCDTHTCIQSHMHTHTLSLALSHTHTLSLSHIHTCIHLFVLSAKNSFFLNSWQCRWQIKILIIYYLCKYVELQWYKIRHESAEYKWFVIIVEHNHTSEMIIITLSSMLKRNHIHLNDIANDQRTLAQKVTLLVLKIYSEWYNFAKALIVHKYVSCYERYFIHFLFYFIFGVQLKQWKLGYKHKILAHDTTRQYQLRHRRLIFFLNRPYQS